MQNDKSERLKMKTKQTHGENILCRTVNRLDLSRLLRFAALLFVRAYQALLSPFLGGACRFEPTCSQYAVEVLQKQSPQNALILILKRLSKCHPWGSHGFDPPPDTAIKSPYIRERNFIS